MNNVDPSIALYNFEFPLVSKKIAQIIATAIIRDRFSSERFSTHPTLEVRDDGDFWLVEAANVNFGGTSNEVQRLVFKIRKLNGEIISIRG